MKYLAIFFGLLFLLFAYYQFNDPDPEIWIPVYALAALACFMALRNALSWWVFGVMAVSYFVAAVLQWPSEFHGIFFGEMQMRDMNIELARESLGLAICGIVMGIFAFFRKKQATF